MKKLSLIVTISLICTMIVPTFVFAASKGTINVVDGEYYYDGFEGYTGEAILESTVGYYASNSVFSSYSDSKNGTGLKIQNAATTFNVFNGPRGNADSYFDVTPAQFENAGKSLVFSADVLIKDPSNKNNAGLYVMLNALKGTGNDAWTNNGAASSVSALPMYVDHWSQGPSFFVPIKPDGTTGNADWTGGNETDFVTTTKNDASAWVKLTSVVTYDATRQKYVTTSYVDGKPIYNATTGEISKLYVTASSAEVATRTRFGITVRCRTNSDTSTDEYVVVDNLAMYLCDTAVPQTGTVSGKTITIPFKNGKTFTDVNAPSVVTNGYLNVDTASTAKLTTENGTVISGATITATGNEIKVTVPSNIGNGAKVKVDLTGVKDIVGNQVDLDSSIYTINGSINVANSEYFQDFEGVTNLNDIGYYPGSSTTAGERAFVLENTMDKGTGLAVNYTSASGSTSIAAPAAGNSGYALELNAASFEGAGKEIEFGYDVYIPAGAYANQSLAGYLVLRNENGGTIQACSEVPWLTYTNAENPDLKFCTINDDCTDNAQDKTGVDRTNNSVYVDYDDAQSSWVSIKSRVSYVKDTDGKGYYLTKYYVNDNVVRNEDGSPVIFKVPEAATAQSGRKYVNCAFYANNGENNPNKLIIDDIFIKVVDAEEEEEPIIPPTPSVPENPYYYEDFEAYTGVDDWFNPNSTNGYYSATGDIFSKYSGGINGTGVKIINPTSTFKQFNGPRGYHAENYFNISPEQFENAGKSLVFSADVLLKDDFNYDGSGLYIHLNALKGTDGNWTNFNTKAYSISTLPMYTDHWRQGPMFFVPIKPDGTTTDAGWTGGNETDYVVTKNYDGWTWMKLTSVVTYDAVNEKYVTTSYIDGKPICNVTTGEVSKLEVTASAADVANRTRLGVTVYYRALGELGAEPYVVVDNICVRMQDEIVTEQYMTVPSNSNQISIPIYNAKQFEGEDVPDYVKKAVIINTALNQGNIIIEKFSQEDKFVLNGTKVEGYTGNLNDNIIDLTNISERQNGENLRITLKNIESVVDGNKLDSTVFVTSDENFKGIMKSCFKSINGDELLVASAESVPTEVNKLELTLRGVGEAIITDGTTTYTATDGVFDFTADPLKPNTTYTIKFEGNDYTTFKTVNSGALSFSDISVAAGNAAVKYVNTLNEDKTVYFVVMYFDSSNKLVKAVPVAKNAVKDTSDIMTVPIDSSIGAAYCKMMILDGLQTVNPLTSMFISPEQSVEQTSIAAAKEIEIASFDNVRSALVKGTLTEKTKQRVTAVLLDTGGNLVYANDLYSANDGSYSFGINMSDTAETGTYYLYAVAGGRVLANRTEVHYSKDSSTALALVNSASTAELMAQVIKENQEDLEFYYDEYYTLFNDSDKLAVAALMLKEKNDLKTENGVGFITTDKKASVDVFRKAVIVHAIKLGKVTNYLEIVPYFNELSTGVVYEWLDNNGSKGISSALRGKWQTGVLNRLKGTTFTSFEDFVSKLRVSLVFECIADSNGYENIRGILTEYVNQGYISGLSSTYVTNTICSNLVGKVYTGFNYTQLITDITTYYNNLSNNVNNNIIGGGTGGGGGVGAVFPGGTNPPTPIAGNEGAVNSENDAKYDTFRDISDCWAKDIILELAKENIISGIGDDYFAPERNITREEFAAIIVRMLDLSVISEAELPFADVTEDDWCHDVVKIAYQHGIINGKSNSQFGKGESISRQDMAVMLKNVLDVSKIDYEEGTVSFVDMAEIAGYAQRAVNILAETKIINGYEDNTFRPNGLATRAEASKVIYEVLKVLSR